LLFWQHQVRAKLNLLSLIEQVDMMEM